MDNVAKNSTHKDDIAPHKKRALKAAIDQGLLSKDNPLLALVNSAGINNTVETLHNAFPDNFRHCFAVKANPYLQILKQLKIAGMDAEVASAPELELALKAGFSGQQIIFDAPVKTPQEIDRALSLGIAFNIDNFQELERVATWMKNNTSNSSIGFRINPQIGAGAITRTSTATLTSKFGIGLNDPGNHQKLLQACQKYPWINTIHVHVGSIACPLNLMTHGVAVALKLAQDINAAVAATQINKLDIGGGLPVDFSQDKDTPTFEDYAEAIRQSSPSLFTSQYQITTEFGRAILGKNGMTIGRVEYTKIMGKQPIALSHIGVQTLLRTVYEPQHWERRISAFDASGNLKTGNEIGQDIAGPACFSGDLIAHNRSLPRLQPGDYILVHDTGAYHFSNHYQYNALPRLPVYSYQIDQHNQVHFKSVSSGQSINDVINDYS